VFELEFEPVHARARLRQRALGDALGVRGRVEERLTHAHASMVRVRVRVRGRRGAPSTWSPVRIRDCDCYVMLWRPFNAPITV
jgi:hypothetical protein